MEELTVLDSESLGERVVLLLRGLHSDEGSGQMVGAVIERVVSRSSTPTLRRRVRVSD